MKVYADNAATTKMDQEAFEAMLPWLLNEYGNASQPYSFSRKPKNAIAEARAIIAKCIGADSDEIYFTSGGTESNNWVIKEVATSNCERRATITSEFEHHAILRSCASIERIGYPVFYLSPTPEGQIEPKSLENAMAENSILVSIMFANNEIGSIQPIKMLCDIAHASGAFFHTDAVQAVGHVRINVHELGVDFLSASAHKFNGPKGIGFLYARRGVSLQPFLDGGSQENGWRAGTENVASIIGMATALKANCEALENNISSITKLEKKLLSDIEGKGIVYIRNGGTNTLPGLLSLSFAGKDAEAILHRMDLMGISISTGAACDSVNTQISHVLKSIKMDPALARGTIRISLGKNNTEDDVDKIVEALSKIVG